MHVFWLRLRRFVAVLAIVRFSLLVPALLGLTLIIADQIIDLLRSVGEDLHAKPVGWLLVMTTFAALVVWYTARTMLRFNFASNRASRPAVHPALKRLLPRALGISIPAMLTVRVATLIPDSGDPAGLWLFTGMLILITLAVSLFVIARRAAAMRLKLPALAMPEPLEKRDLHRWRELPTTTRTVLYALMITNVIVLALFVSTTFYEWGGPVALGAPAILLLGLGLTTVTGSALVYLGNRFAVPVLSLFLLWGVVCSIGNDNHRVRVTAESPSHALGDGAEAAASPVLPAMPPGTDFEAYAKIWWQRLEHDTPAGDSRIPVVVVAAEGGGLRAAYWTAIVLARLEEQTANEAVPFSRHVIALSGVSGGSVGAAIFAAAIAQRANVADPAKAIVPVNLVDEMDGLLAGDFLADTLGAGLFPDLLQRFLPVPLFNDRAIALERAFERAWSTAYPGDNARFRGPFVDLWREHPYDVPLLYLNSTVVETGQRAINSPLANTSLQPESAFADALPLGQFLGTAVPLSTAALLSARFTYVSPAGLIDTRRTVAPRWVRIVDGGYFDNSGTTTAQELVRVLQVQQAQNDRDPAHHRGMRIIVLHLPNEPEIPSARLDQKTRDSSRFELLSEIEAPIATLLQTRGARGTQAVSYLHGEPGVEMVSVRPCRVKVGAPLGWVLSREVRAEMKGQVMDCKGLGANCASARIDWISEVLTQDGASPMPSELDRPADCRPSEPADGKSSP